jgi:hypothetical protein
VTRGRYRTIFHIGETSPDRYRRLPRRGQARRDAPDRMQRQADRIRGVGVATLRGETLYRVKPARGRGLSQALLALTRGAGPGLQCPGLPVLDTNARSLRQNGGGALDIARAATARHPHYSLKQPFNATNWYRKCSRTGCPSGNPVTLRNSVNAGDRGRYCREHMQLGEHFPDDRQPTVGLVESIQRQELKRVNCALAARRSRNCG